MSRLGRKALPRDDRDYRIADLLTPTTQTRKYYYRPLILDQGNTGTCEGNAWTGWLADGPVTHPSITALKDSTTGEAYARELYVQATGDQTLEQGAYTRQILRVLVSRGLLGAYYRAASVDEVVVKLSKLLIRLNGQREEDIYEKYPTVFCCDIGCTIRPGTRASGTSKNRSSHRHSWR